MSYNFTWHYVGGGIHHRRNIKNASCEKCLMCWEKSIISKDERDTEKICYQRLSDKYHKTVSDNEKCKYFCQR